MKGITFCLLDNDAQYIKAFMSVVAAEYPGYTVKARHMCYADCSEDVDACIRFAPYINEIKEYIGDMQTEDFLNDKKTMTACAFSVSQIGELAKEISDESQAKYNTIPWQAIKGMRNKIVHDYENIDLAVLWGTIEKSLPELKVHLEKVLFENIEEII